MNNFEPQKEPMELHATVWGRVQGVGFRGTARYYAQQLGLKGTVSNLDDGNVEIFAQGSREKLEEFLKLLKEHFSSGYIARIDTKYQKIHKNFERFTIV